MPAPVMTDYAPDERRIFLDKCQHNRAWILLVLWFFVLVIVTCALGIAWNLRENEVRADERAKMARTLCADRIRTGGFTWSLSKSDGRQWIIACTETRTVMQ